MFRKIANPRRTTLAHLEDADDLQPPEQPEHSVDLPAQTANPRRTVLMEPRSRSAAAESTADRAPGVAAEPCGAGPRPDPASPTASARACRAEPRGAPRRVSLERQTPAGRVEGRKHPVRIARFSIDGNVAFGAVEGDRAGRARPRHHQGHPVRGLRALRHEGPAEQGPAAAPGAPQQGRGLRPQLRGPREGTRQRGPRRPVRLLQALHLGDRPRRRDPVPAPSPRTCTTRPSSPSSSAGCAARSRASASRT